MIDGALEQLYEEVKKMRSYPYDTQGAMDTVLSRTSKFTEEDVNEDLRHLALDYLLSLPAPISFQFLKDLRLQVGYGGVLSDKQYAGVLNCMRTQVRRSAPIQVEEGVYLDPNSDRIYKVQKSRQTGRLYAKRLVIERHPEWDPEGRRVKPALVRFVFEPGVVNNLTPEMRLTKEQAKEHGAYHGTCVSCGAHLSDEDSVDRMMGPVCYKRQFKEE